MSQPNFVVVMTDDQGRWAMPHRMPELVMPNLADLLDDSLELDQFYCASPVCSPARATLLTGRMPSAHGVHDWLVGTRHPEAHPDLYLEGQPTTPEVLGDAGYECAMVGKWHVGDAREPAPGFSFWYAHRFGGGPYFEAPIWNDGEPVDEKRYFTTAVTENALEFLRARDRERPFYLQVNYTAPHDPWINNHPDEYLRHYEGCTFPSVPREEPHPWVQPRKADFEEAFADPEPHLAGYCAALTAVDEGLGRIREALTRQGVAEDTVLVFMSDNGFSCGHHGVWGKGNGTQPLNLWDNSVRVPFVIRVPGGARGVSDALVPAAALHPTICELAGVPVPQDGWSAGASVAPLVRGETTEGHDAVVVHSEYGGARMITDGTWKYIERVKGPDELYHLVTDPEESHNLVDIPAHIERIRDLADRMAAWFAVHERSRESAYNKPVTGYGQIHPTWREEPAIASYVQGSMTLDGVRTD